MSRTDLAMDGRRSYSPKSPKSPSKGSSSASATPIEKYPKNVAFEFPPREAARCTSPSWEAYERRKTEKKAEKKEQEEIRNAKTKRLSKKPPPPSSPKALQQALASDADASRGRRRERPEAASPAKEIKPPRKTRSRSGSFVSMLRAPFERRRSSQDQSNDAGFIGGIKLELKRQADQQQVLDSSAVEDESNIHPALRKNNPLCNQTGDALRLSPASPRTSASEGAENQRRYPPITRRNQTQRPMSLNSSQVPSVPDLSKIEKWRAKVGLKTSSRPGSQCGSEISLQPSGHASPAPGAVYQTETTVVAIGKPKPSNSFSPQANFEMTAAPSPNFDPAQKTDICVAQEQNGQRRPDIKRMRNANNNESISSVSSGATAYKTAPSSPLPPEPPRRSYKRSSWLHTSEPMPPLPIAHEMLQQRSTSSFSTTPDSPPKRHTPLFSNGARVCKIVASKGETPVSTFARAMNTSPVDFPRVVGNPTTSSSEESSSEDFHYTSNVSTPATSRPQSEQDMSLVASKTEIGKPESIAHQSQLSVIDTTYPLPSAENSEAEGEGIQAAAERVLAVFNGIPVKKPGLRRHNSQSSLATDISFEPRFRERPLRLRPKTKAAAQTQRLESPASYLKEARTQPPAAPPARTRKQRIGPPASFLLPDDSSYATDDTLTPSSAAPDTIGRSVVYKSTPQLKTSDREPITKAFVECCSCGSYHDMPKNLYEAMAEPERMLNAADKYGYVGALSMTVRCSWCKHEMNVRCCAGLATTVYIKERLH
ncbi:hypothetical protein AAL_07620 [Moelleriella libera RCEF 2490]|uniref:Uncharacterized protein n=1 Tax=Moelleriella libera RCEF 2490 TaxID=1081109 RepID=A0A167X7J4_9HYPO|nr:hypothetical protein AAL_07620 [Moelleriella libera RCEF 2490]